MADTYFFNGRTYSTPGVMSKIIDTGELPANPTIGNTVAFIGLCIGGAPATPIVFGDPVSPAASLVSGDLLVAVQKAFAVSTDDAINAPSAVLAVPVIAAAATQSVLTINGVAIPAVIYGTSTGSMLIEAVAGSVRGYGLGIQLNGKTVYSDNVADTPFVITNGSTYPLVLGAVAKQATTWNSTLTGATPSAYNVPLQDSAGNYLTLANFINSFNSTFAGTGVSATMGTVSGPLAGNTPIDQVFDVTSATPSVAVGTSYTFVTVMRAIVSFFGNSGFFSFKPATGSFIPWTINSVSAVAPAVYNFGYTLLAGIAATQWSSVIGTNGTVSNSDWAAAFNALQAQDVQWICPLSTMPAIWAMGDAHVQYMATVAKERRQIVGPAVGTTQSAVETMAANLNSNRTAIAFPGYWDFNSNGVLTLLSSAFTAALAAAAFGGMDIGEPLTEKTFTVQGWEVVLRNPTDTDPLIQNGVMCFYQDTTGYICARSISTWKQDNKYDKVELSVGFASDEVSRVVRAACRPFNGGKNDPFALARVLKAAEVALNGLAVPEPNGPAIIVGDANSPAWTGLVGTLVGDAIAVTFQCSPVLPNNFIPITISIVPYSGTQTISP